MVLWVALKIAGVYITSIYVLYEGMKYHEKRFHAKI